MKPIRSLSFLIVLALAAAAQATVQSFTFDVPHKVGVGQMEIAVAKVTVSVASEAAVTFRISHANGSGPLANVVTNPLTPDQISNCFSGGNCFTLYPNNDIVAVSPPSTNGKPPGDPERRKYTFFFNLNGNIDRNNNCVSLLTASEQWTITVLPGSPEIDRVCVQSFDPQTAGVGSCNNAQVRIVPLTEPVATVTGQAANLQGCRVGLDCVLVLDRSGSMNDPVIGGSPTPKIQRLRDSVVNFMNVWQQLRDNETSMSASPQIVGSPDDRVGVVFFDSAAAWLKTLDPSSTTNTGLNPFTTAIKNDINAKVPGIPTAGSTSIGDGIRTGANAVTSGTNRKALLLMTDGIQNTNPFAQVTGAQAQIKDGAVVTPLPNQPPLQIYSLTVGSGSMVDPAINQALATASGGFYMNTETDSGILPSLFLELLQNFVRYSTFETLRLVTGSVNRSTPFDTSIPVTGTTQSLVFNLSWEPRNGSLRMLVQPPNGAPSLIGSPSGPGFLTLSTVLPRPGFSQRGDWQVRIIGAGFESATIPFNLVVLGDDSAVNSDLSPVVAQYRPGGRVVVHARVRDLGKTLTTIGSGSGDRAVVQLLQPGQSIGDLLSDSGASAVPPPGGDKLSAAEAKLANMLKADPSLLKKVENTLTLVDDGSAATGDDVAGDGIYSAVFTPELEGHYNLLFAIEADSSAGRFTRQQLRTIHVKPAPDASKTEISSVVRPNVLVVNMTPRTATNHRLGPGWGPYFWFKAGNGQTVRPVDNLNGTYTASILFNGSTPPSVSVHYIDDPVKIPEDTTTESALPVPLVPGNVLIPNVPSGSSGPGNPFVPGAWRFFLDAGVNFPHGDLSNGADGKFSINTGFERLFGNNSIEGILGYHRFDIAFVSNPHTWQLSVNGKHYFGSTPLHPFVNAGVGAYRFDPGNETKFGWNAGGGVLYDLSSKWGIEAVYNYHDVNADGGHVQFSTLQGGFRVSF